MRVFNWDSKLVRYAEEMRGREYEWGETDCATLALDSLNIMYEGDLADSLPSWTTLRGARSALKKLEGVRGGLEVLGASRASKKFEQSGDILLKEGEDFPALGVAVSGDVLSSTHERGVYVEPIHEFGHDEVYRV